MGLSRFHKRKFSLAREKTVKDKLSRVSLAQWLTENLNKSILFVVKLSEINCTTQKF